MSSGTTVPRKRRHVERPDVRKNLLDAAEALVREQGYAAATARSIAKRLGLKHQVVFYYFGTQDELLTALFQRAAEAYRERLKAALNSDRPLSAMWAVISDPEATKLTLEFMALANHNDLIRAEIARNAEKVRVLETGAIAKYLDERGINPHISSELVSILTNALARLLVQEATLGIHTGHSETEALVYRSLSNFESAGQGNAATEVVEAIRSLG